METLFEAWSLWTTQKLNNDYLLWGYEIFKWGRLGKFLQAISITTIAIEIIGLERLSRFASTLKKKYPNPSPRRFIAQVRYFNRSYATVMREQFASPEEDKAQQQMMSTTVGKIFILTKLITFFGTAYFMWSDFSWWLTTLMLSLILFLNLPFIILAISAFTINTYLVRAFYLLFLLPFVTALQSPRIDKWVKASALSLGIIGLHFDFLAS
ncbi:hypothetical protein QNE77_001943 [Vibrio alginolyticus]|nr:hypothetical protein [Vibrio alginolyticus]